MLPSVYKEQHGFFRASSETDCVTFVAGLASIKDDDAASVGFRRWQAY